ncbi:pyrroline-5-carboxylate reductase [Neiella marina]|uniref:Pyrroline-5-carboxylate reductase n=1 Tax=Neiella holothuriorum TaxID=2870530 RepID=A0ABS7EK04_9GAMM|nr:pyrroline-5-carboxylate reductase [Neiella holothuriorum]MBW8192661.1 pyrroline-5-carboxylate reductase [Neiella holothuriorum]
MSQQIAFIGAGNMAGAILKGLIQQGHPAQQVHVSDLDEPKLNALAAEFTGLNTYTDNAACIANADVVVLAVKPQLMAAVCEPLLAAQPSLANKLIVSVAAGIKVARLREMLGNAQRVVRTMPNTPCLIGQGMTGLYADEQVSETDRNAAQTLMQAVGKTAWVESEAGLNHVIAASGSAPAYFFMFMDAMQKSVEAMGLDAVSARQFVQQAAIGSSQLAASQMDKSFTELTAQVTSKGGTTAEAVATFKDGDLAGLVDQALRNCVARAEQMEKQF